MYVQIFFSSTAGNIVHPSKFIGRVLIRQLRFGINIRNFDFIESVRNNTYNHLIPFKSLCLMYCHIFTVFRKNFSKQSI